MGLKLLFRSWHSRVFAHWPVSDGWNSSPKRKQLNDTCMSLKMDSARLWLVWVFRPSTTLSVRDNLKLLALIPHLLNVVSLAQPLIPANLHSLMWLSRLSSIGNHCKRPRLPPKQTGGGVN